LRPGLPVIIGGLIGCGICPEARPVDGMPGWPVFPIKARLALSCALQPALP